MTDKNFLGYAKTQAALDAAKYNDGTPVQYQFINQPGLSVSDWGNVKTLDQTNILAKATLDDLEATN